MATHQNLSIICLRIGAFQPLEAVQDPEKSLWMMNAWLSPRDMTQLIVKCIDNTLIHFGIFNALSGNTLVFQRLHNVNTLTFIFSKSGSTEWIFLWLKNSWDTNPKMIL